MRLAAKLRRSRHAPARHDKLAFAVGPDANDRRELIGEDTWKQRQIAGAIVPRAKPDADGRLAFGQGVEVAHVGASMARLNRAARADAEPRWPPRDQSAIDEGGLDPGLFNALY